jgi:VWFA-related protein
VIASGTLKRLAAIAAFSTFVLPISLSSAQNSSNPAVQNKDVTFKSDVHLVIVPVLVFDAHSNAVLNLTKEDFQLFDRGKRQEISGFSIQRGTAATGANNAGKEVASVAAAAGLPTQRSEPAVPHRFILFLFDDLHLDAGDMSHVRAAAAKVLASTLESTDAAAVLSASGQPNTGFTLDRTKLQDAVTHLRQRYLYAHVHGCPDVSYYQADLIVNMSDSDALAEAMADVSRCVADPDKNTAEMLALSAARTELAMGEQGIRSTLSVMQQVVSQMGRLPGEHILVLISPGFPIRTSESRAGDTKLLDIAAQSNVVINTLDARGLYTTMLDSSQRYVTQAKEKYNAEALQANDDILAGLASDTGGTYFHNSNDLGEGFKRLTTAPESRYLLEFSPQNAKEDGSYHRLKVTIDRKGLKLKARAGYFAEKPAKK